MPITPQRAVKQLQQIGDPRALRRVLRNAIRRGANAIRKDDISRFRSQGVGRRIFGSSKFRQKNAKGLIGVSRARERGDSVELDIYAKGLAAIQESGGRTAEHPIPPKNFLLKGVPVLVFRVPGRLVVTPNIVEHKGATHPRMPHLQPAIDRGIPNVTREIERAMEGHLDSALR